VELNKAVLEIMLTRFVPMKGFSSLLVDTCTCSTFTYMILYLMYMKPIIYIKTGLRPLPLKISNSLNEVPRG
jgi:hypothetical protein